jgi:hypothetical protein
MHLFSDLGGDLRLMQITSLTRRPMERYKRYISIGVRAWEGLLLCNFLVGRSG